MKQGKICEQGVAERNNSSVRVITNHLRHKKDLRDPYSVRGLKGFRIREGFKEAQLLLFQCFVGLKPSESLKFRQGAWNANLIDKVMTVPIMTAKEHHCVQTEGRRLEPPIKVLNLRFFAKKYYTVNNFVQNIRI